MLLVSFVSAGRSSQIELMERVRAMGVGNRSAVGDDDGLGVVVEKLVDLGRGRGNPRRFDSVSVSWSSQRCLMSVQVRVCRRRNENETVNCLGETQLEATVFRHRW